MARRGCLLRWLSSAWFGGTPPPDRAGSYAVFPSGLPTLRRSIACKNSGAGSECLGDYPDFLRAATNFYLSARVLFYRSAHAFLRYGLIQATLCFAAADNSLGEPPRRVHPWPDDHSALRGVCRLRLGGRSGGAGGNEEARHPFPDHLRG